MSARTIALTGATGFLGSHVLDAIDPATHVRALARRPQAARAGVEWIAGALDDRASLERLCAGVDAVIHVAGVVNGDDAAFRAGNVDGTAAILAATPPDARFVHISSLSARRPDLSAYGASKAASEALVLAWPGRAVVVRPPGIYGPRDTEVLELFRMASRGVVALPPAGRASWIHAADLARLIVALADARGVSGVIEPDDGTPGGWRHDDFARALGRAVGRSRVLPLSLPRAVLSLAARADALVRGRDAKLTPDRVAYMCHPDWTVDPARAAPPALWRPAIATPDGLRDTAAWYREQARL